MARSEAASSTVAALPPRAGPSRSTGAAPSLDTGRYEQEAVAEERGVLEVDAAEGGYRADAGRNV